MRSVVNRNGTGYAITPTASEKNSLSTLRRKIPNHRFQLHQKPICIPRKRTISTTIAHFTILSAMLSDNSDSDLSVFVPPKPTESPTDTDSSASLLLSLASLPSLAKAWTFPSTDGVRVALQINQRNLPANAVRKYLTHFSLNEAILENVGAADTSLPMDLKDSILVSPSPSGTRMIVVRPGSQSNGSSKNNDSACVIEIWDRSRVLHEIHVPSALHGSIYNDGWFGNGVSWSKDESAVCYVAESPKLVTTPEWKAPSATPDKASAGPKGWRGIGEHQEDWGELQTGKRPPTLFVLDIENGSVEHVQGLPENSSVGQPQWSPDGSSLIFVAWPHSCSNFPDFPRRLGIVFCFNRPCALHAVAWPQPKLRGTAGPTIRLVPTSLHSSFSPRFSPDGRTLIMLSQQSAVESGVHSATPALLALNWTVHGPLEANAAPNNALRTVVDVVWKPSSPEEFPGLYCSVLPDQPFITDSIIVTTAQWRSVLSIVAIDTTEGHHGQVKRISPVTAINSSWSLLSATCTSGWMLATESHPGQPFKVYVCHVPESQRSQPEHWCWSRLELPDTEKIPENLAQVLKEIETEFVPLSVDSDDVPGEAFIIKRKDLAGPLPTILTPHGGPHTAYPAQFFMPNAFLAASGYCVVMVNYRGSTGFGESCIQSLPGSIGTKDVVDCMTALNTAIDAGVADPARVAAIGGSHGGFLSTHLIGQYPDAFKAAVLRNPVCNIALMVHLTDIPDWCYIESYGVVEGKARARSGPTPEDVERMSLVSPIRYVDSVTAPVLLMLGACDRRVPIDDGKRYLEMLKRNKNATETRMTVFPQDAHGLDKPQTEFEQWLTALWWVDRHVNSKVGG